MSNKEKEIKPDIKGEMDEIQRLSQDLKRDEDVDVSVDEIIKSFEKSEQETLTDDIWEKLENTESNEIDKGDWDSVMKIAKTYNKTNPKKLKKSIESGEYKRPLIVKLGERYILMAGNTRLCTAAAMGINPLVFIGNIEVNDELNEKWSQKYKNSIDCNNPKGFSQRAHCQGKKKKMNENEVLKGGVSDKKSLKDICKKHGVNSDDLNKEFSKGVKVEMEHTNDKKKASEIAMDHLWEDPKYYSKLKKIETKESMSGDASGAFEGPAFGTKIKKRVIYKPNNYKKYNANENKQVNEVVDSSSSGMYDAPFGDGGKKPLKIKGEKSIKNSRAVKDKKFPKWGGPGSIFVKIKEKCKKFPYCNQGDINAIELLEIQDEVKEVSKKYGIPYKEMEKVVLNEINKIFINMNMSDLNSLIESVATKEVKKTIISESKKAGKEVYHIMCDGEPIDTFNSKEEAEEALPKYQKKNKGELIIEPEMYESYEDMIEKMDKMGQELEEKENQDMKNSKLKEGEDYDEKEKLERWLEDNPEEYAKNHGFSSGEMDEGNEFTAALAKAKEAGEDKFTVGGKEYDVEECWSKQMSEGKGMCNECGSMLNEEGMCNECGSMNESKVTKKLRLTETELIKMINRIVSESVPGIDVTKKAQTQSKKDNEQNAKEVERKIKKATTIKGSSNPEFPHQNNGGEKMAIHNTEEENEYVQDTRGGTSLNLDYDHEPSKSFKDRLRDAIQGSSKMGNSSDAANVVKSDLGKNLSKQAERKAKKEKEQPMYIKDVQPVNESKNETNRILVEEVERMKKMALYNTKTQ